VLKSHNLAEEELDAGTDYALPLLRQHNLICRVAVDRLQADPTAWNDAHRTAAHLWQTPYEPAPDAPNLEVLRGSLEAFHHFCELEDWAAASDILIGQDVGRQLHNWAYYRERLPLYERLLGKLDTTVDVVCKKEIGVAYGALGNYPEAIEHFQQSLAAARRIGDRQGEGKALGCLGTICWLLGNYPQAIENHEQDLTIAREINDRKGEGLALGNLGNAYRVMNNYPQAIKYHKQNLAIAREISDRKGEGSALVNLGYAHYSMGNYPQAIEYYQQRLNIAREIGDRQGEGKRTS
jgi:tetratricopeptide (TPR) repeat protein